MLTRSCVRFGWLVLGIGLLTCSCAKEPDEIMGTGDDDASLIVPEAFVGDVVETETKADLSGVVIGTSFPANTTKVFSVVGYKGTAAPTNWSSPYINNIAVNSGTSSTLSFATPQYYPVDGQKVYFYAYSPVKGATYTAGSGSTAPKVTWTLDGHTDVMAAQVTTGIAKAATGTQSQPAFAFTHKLMQLKFKVMKDAALTDLGNVTALTVNNAATSLSMTLSNGTVTTLSTGSLTAYSSTTGQAVTTTSAYLGTNGSPFLTTKTDNLTLTLTCGGEDWTIIPDLPADAGPGKTVEITLKLTPAGVVIRSITLNSSTSLTIPRAGGTFTLVAQTRTSLTDNITWKVKDTDGNDVGRSTSYSAYNTATVSVDESKEWYEKNLTLYWSYATPTYVALDCEYTLKQDASKISSATFSVGATSSSTIETYLYQGVRTLQVAGDWSSDAQIKLTNGRTTIGPLTLSSQTLVRFPLNEAGATLDWTILALNSDGGYTTTSWHLKQSTTYNLLHTPTNWSYVNGLMMLYLGKSLWSQCNNDCGALGGAIPTFDQFNSEYMALAMNTEFANSGWEMTGLTHTSRDALHFAAFIPDLQEWLDLESESDETRHCFCTQD